MSSERADVPSQVQIRRFEPGDAGGVGAGYQEIGRGEKHGYTILRLRKTLP